MKIFRRFSSKLQAITSTIFLSLSYVVGIGVSSCVGKVIGKRFLKESPAVSMWENHVRDVTTDRMY